MSLMDIHATIESESMHNDLTSDAMEVFGSGNCLGPSVYSGMTSTSNWEFSGDS